MIVIFENSLQPFKQNLFLRRDCTKELHVSLTTMRIRDIRNQMRAPNISDKYSSIKVNVLLNAYNKRTSMINRGENLRAQNYMNYGANMTYIKQKLFHAPITQNPKLLLESEHFQEDQSPNMVLITRRAPCHLLMVQTLGHKQILMLFFPRFICS